MPDFSKETFESQAGCCGRCKAAKVRTKVVGREGEVCNLTPHYMAGWCTELTSPNFGTLVGRFGSCLAFREARTVTPVTKPFALAVEPTALR